MEPRYLLSIASGVLFLIGFGRYIFAIVKGTTKPATASWLIWAAQDWILIAGLYAENALNGQIIAALIGVNTVAALSLFRGKAGWTKTDVFCLAGAVLGIGLWFASGDPLLAILTILAVIFLGGIPTFVSAYHHPEREDRTAWTILTLSCIASVAAVPAWTLADASQPVSFLLSELIMMYLLFVHPRNRPAIRA